MNIKTNFLLIATAIGITACSTAKADNVEYARVMGEGQRCDHVIRLIVQHGVNNSVNLNPSNALHSAGFGSMVIPESEIGDLQLKQVTKVQHSDPACGPTFAVVIHNASSREVCGPRISAVGLLGRIRSNSPTQVVKVDKILAGQSLEVQIKLPIEALTMGNHNGTAIGFRRLLIAIDSYDQFVETNEANNIKVFDVASIPIATGPVPSAATSPTATTGVVSQTLDVAPMSTQSAAAPKQQPAAVTQASETVEPKMTSPTDEVQSAMRRLNASQPNEQMASLSL